MGHPKMPLLLGRSQGTQKYHSFFVLPLFFSLMKNKLVMKLFSPFLLLQLYYKILQRQGCIFSLLTSLPLSQPPQSVWLIFSLPTCLISMTVPVLLRWSWLCHAPQGNKYQSGLPRMESSVCFTSWEASYPSLITRHSWNSFFCFWLLPCSWPRSPQVNRISRRGWESGNPMHVQRTLGALTGWAGRKAW